jgi:catechol 2,3-dioxygenase-like lactoylglutathione lyase family enzyme
MNDVALGSHFHHVSYVVTDVARAAERFRSLVPGAVFSTSRIALRPVHTNLSGPPMTEPIQLQCATAPVGPRGEYEIRLIEPLNHDPIFHWSLTSDGPGLHHVGFSVHALEPAATRMARSASLIAQLCGEDGGRHLYYRCDPIGAIIELTSASANRQAAGKEVPRSSLAAHFTQIAYVVEDIAAARQWTQEALGCEIAPVRDVVQGPSWNLHFRGKPIDHDFSLKMTIGKLGPTGEGQIELLEPERKDNVIADFLKDHGPGLNHIAFVVPDYDSLTRPLRSTGVPPLKEIHVPGMVHSSYFDCNREELSTIEVYETGPHA